MIEAYLFECIAFSYKAANGRTYYKGQKFHVCPQHPDFAFFNSDSCFKKTRRDVPPENARLVGALAPALPAAAMPEAAPPAPEPLPEELPAGDMPPSGEEDLSVLDLDEKTFEVLLKNGIGNVGQLSEYDTVDKLKTLRGVGEATAAKILVAQNAYRASQTTEDQE